ncbi:hypothetical protein [Nostoc sp. C057]|nr:hypothetical protein [Nostoc sp. C057]
MVALLYFRGLGGKARRKSRARPPTAERLAECLRSQGIDPDSLS